MAVSTDILRTWRDPRVVMRQLLSMGPREDQAILYVMAGCLLIFVAQWPRLVRVSAITGDELDRLIAYEFMAWLIVWPLILYALASLIGGLLWVVRRPVPGHAVRLALFWSFLAASPMALIYGVVVGLNGFSTLAHLVGALWIGAFLLFLVLTIREAIAASSRLP
jgi:hypothetical protein